MEILLTLEGEEGAYITSAPWKIISGAAPNMYSFLSIVDKNKKFFKL